MSTDEKAIGRVIDEMYATVSGPKGKRDWSRNGETFHDVGRRVRTGVDERGTPWANIMDQARYEADTAPFFAANDFFEIETSRRIQIFGNIAHVWSLYEARNAPDDAHAERRGINSIQLLKCEDGKWRIISMIWDNERAGLKHPVSA